MYINIVEPTEEISTDVVKVWRISNTIENGLTLLIITTLIVCTEMFGWYEWIGTILYILGGLCVLYSIFVIIFQPIYLQRTWRYRIDSQFVQLKHGKWKEKHTLIPMEKVEYVRSEQGPIMRLYKLYTIEIGTTTSNHVIPAIPHEEAIKLKAQIATFAKIQDQDGMEGEKDA